MIKPLRNTYGNSIPGRHLLVPEFQALYDHCTLKQQQESRDRSEMQFGNVNQSLAFAALLRKLGNRIPNWNRDVIDFWERLRQFVLKNPTISREGSTKYRSSEVLFAVSNKRISPYILLSHQRRLSKSIGN